VSPVIVYHSTARRHRESIERHGLLGNLPNAGQWWGIYTFRDDYRHIPPRDRRNRRTWTIWTHHEPNDLWEIAYIGPLLPDQYVANGLVLTERPEFVSRVSRLS